jgi:pimeloyl-ACP methyl ester carboxylesterase
MSHPPAPLRTLVERFDRSEYDSPARRSRVRLTVSGRGAWDALVDRDGARLVSASRRAEPDAVIEGEEGAWRRLAADLASGMSAFRAGRLIVRRNLHLGISFLVATSASREPARLRFVPVRTARGTVSTMQAGVGDPVVLLHGLGGTKASFLPTLADLATAHRLIAIDLPGFGESDKPLGAPYDPSFFARWMVALLDALGLERAHLVGNSLGGRVALEVGLAHPDRVDRIALLAPSLAWLRTRRWAPWLRLVRPELGAFQLTPRGVVDPLVRRLVPGAATGWTAAGVDEFLRSFLTPRGRAAFYAAARNVYIEEPHGPRGLWTRLEELERPALFVWGRRDQLVPIAFQRHVRAALPDAQHLELDCGHVPQVELPRKTHAALAEFFAGRAVASGGHAQRAREARVSRRRAAGGSSHRR